MNDDRGRIVNRVLALFVFVVVLVVYVRTMAASVSFWDCGEFIACAHILGIPHPPGAPLHGLLGRLFSLLPLFGTVARRLNFLSALTGALSAGMLYLVTERVARGWFGEGLGWRGRLLGMVGGVTAGMFMAFSDTYWSNAIEAEVYAPAMFLMVLAIWLALRWQEVRGERGGDQMLLVLVYVLFLGIGVHQTAFLVYFPLLWLFVVLVDRERLSDWRYWLVAFPLGIVVVFSLAKPFMWVGGALLVISFMGMEVGGKDHRRRWRFCFWFVLLALAGYTLQAFIPLRSLLDPAIDENNPDSWERFMAYLERKQYGQTSMLEGMFHRKGSWLSQFGVHRRMGYWGFFRQGWAPVNWWPLVVGVGLLGMVVGWFPGVSSAQATILAVSKRDGDGGDSVDGARRFIAGVSAVNTANAVFNLVALATFLRVRSGASAAVLSLSGWAAPPWDGALLPPSDVAALLVAAAVGGVVAAPATLAVGRLASRSASRLADLRALYAILVALVACCWVFGDKGALLVLAVSTALGLVPPLIGLMRVHLMGAITLPLALMLIAA